MSYSPLTLEIVLYPLSGSYETETVVGSARKIGNTNWFSGSRIEPIPVNEIPALLLSNLSKTGVCMSVSGLNMFLD